MDDMSKDEIVAPELWWQVIADGTPALLNRKEFKPGTEDLAKYRWLLRSWILDENQPLDTFFYHYNSLLYSKSLS